MREQNNFINGITDGLPICFGYLSVSFAFGIFAIGNGFNIFETVLISMTNLTSAGQLAGVPIIAAGGSLIELAVSQLIINLRYSLMSISLSQNLGDSVHFWDRLWIAFVNTDEIFAVASSNQGGVGRKYMAGLAITPYVGWTSGTVLGAVAGDILPTSVTAALGIAIYAMFVAIVVPETKKSTSTLLCVIFAIALSCLFSYAPILSEIPSGFVIIICAVVASALFAVLYPTTSEVAEDE